MASKVVVSRQTVHAWLARYEAEGLEGFAVFEDVVRLTAQALGIELDDVRCVSEFAQTTSDLDLG